MFKTLLRMPIGFQLMPGFTYNPKVALTLGKGCADEVSYIEGFYVGTPIRMVSGNNGDGPQASGNAL
ncbi:hypothetical protein KSX_51160 [Ktedonospora formicarum]|uniref:Uncharacterized protein n=1 Tax=Ktedonospora formicarum TaxID=2778364 RepID=A0A8J3I6W9_9CHLR|nr:hypothetical protein KSX_51160 [Ktedonospora formicarum]